MFVGMQEEDIFRSVTAKHPDIVTLSCPIGSSDEVYWDKLSIDGSEQSSYLQGSSFRYSLSSFDQSAKFACHSNHLHSIVYVHPKGERAVVAVTISYPLHDRL